MNTKQLKDFGKKCINALGKKSPVILTVLGIGSGAAAIALTVKATVRAVDLLEEEKCLRVERDEPEEMTKMEVVKAVWKPYIPVAVAGTFSAACFIGSCSVHSRRNAALAAAYKITFRSCQAVLAIYNFVGTKYAKYRYNAKSRCRFLRTNDTDQLSAGRTLSNRILLPKK